MSVHPSQPQIQEGAQGIPKEKARVKGQEQGAPDPRRGPSVSSLWHPQDPPRITPWKQWILEEEIIPLCLSMAFRRQLVTEVFVPMPNKNQFESA